jgi:hypothetical protein
VKEFASKSFEGLQTENQISLTGETDDLIFYFATLEEKKSRNIADSKSAGKSWTVVHVHFGDFDILALFFRDLIQYWGHHPARAAPGSPKIDYNRDRRFADRLIKVGFVQVYYRCILAAAGNCDCYSLCKLPP